MDDNEDWEMIHAYSRAQALEDGVLIDVSELAKEAGFRYPVAVTSAVWHWIEPPEDAEGQDERGRLWDILWVLKTEIFKNNQQGQGGREIHFKVLFDQGKEKPLVDFYSVCGPGDNLEPVITVMVEGED